jgi:hypothetical protein
MKKLTITIRTENAAFDESPELEVARILRSLANRMEVDGVEDRNILDVNGNKVGEVKVR